VGGGEKRGETKPIGEEIYGGIERCEKVFNRLGREIKFGFESVDFYRNLF
jgi:hypothetical protein